jgi:uncharacterized protein (TIGR02265 family)
VTARIKGYVLNSRLAFVSEKFGPGALADVLSSLPEADRSVLGEVILVSSWYASELCQRLDEAIIRIIGGRSEAAFKELGRKSADDNLIKFQAGFLRGKTPKMFLEQTPAIYKLYYDVGSREYQSTSPTSGQLITRDGESVSYGDCLTIMGWHERALELTGAKNPLVTHPVCKARGGNVCRYEVSWEDRFAAPRQSDAVQPDKNPALAS